MNPLLPRLLFPALAVLAIPSSAPAQCFAQRLEGTTNLISDSFGRGLDVDSVRLVVGASRDRAGLYQPGTVFIYRETPTGYTQEANLLPTQGLNGDLFGFSVGLANTRLLVGSPGGDGWNQNSGRVHTFKFAGSTWTKGPPLNPGEGTTGDDFGWSIDVDGNIAVVSAPAADTAASGIGGGKVYIFRWNGSVWAYQTSLLPNDLIDQDLFGFDVAIDGFRIIVGCPAQNNGAINSGAAYIYDGNGTQWSLTQKVTPSDPGFNAFFGAAVDVLGDEVLVGAPGALGAGNNSTGAVYFFDDNSGAWTHGTKLTAPNGDPGDRFGASVEMDGGRAIVGSPFADDGANNSFGRVSGLVGSLGNWSIDYTLDGMGTTAGDNQFGGSVVYAGNDLVVGDPADGEGYLYYYMLAGIDCNNNGIPDACDLQAGTSLDADGDGIPDECAPCASANTCHSAPNSTGSAALISFSGSQSLGANDFQLHAGPVPNQIGLFFFGPGSADTPLGNGTLCVSGQIKRLVPRLATGNQLSTALDFSDPSSPAAQITLNSVWYFQAWFRDTATGGSFYNLSDALKVAFCL